MNKEWETLQAVFAPSGFAAKRSTMAAYVNTPRCAADWPGFNAAAASWRVLNPAPAPPAWESIRRRAWGA